MPKAFGFGLDRSFACACACKIHAFIPVGHAIAPANWCLGGFIGGRFRRAHPFGADCAADDFAILRSSARAGLAADAGLTFGAGIGSAAAIGRAG